MVTVLADIAKHRGMQVILLKFPYNQPLINILKSNKETTWSYTLKSWYLPYSVENVKQIHELLNGKAIIDFSGMKEKLELIKRLPPDIKEYSLNAEAVALISKFKNFLQSRRYSENTIATYTDSLTVFFKYYSHKSVTDITNDDLIAFNTNYILANNYSASFQNQVVNAVKLFFRTIQSTTINVELVPRPKSQKLLPNVLNKEEVKRILDAPGFLKHRAMLSLIYSCGLRCGELLRLKPEHIDSKRNVLVIKQAKGRKDRIAPLSDKTIKLLRDYYKAFQPKFYLFEGEKEGTPYTQRSLQLVLKQSATKAGITKPVTLHWLRHSYATHLLESGTDLRYIQEILGHNSSKTTEIYTHVSTKSIQKIVSPFDTL
jgi:integrase/recombinase XerD